MSLMDSAKVSEVSHQPECGRNRRPCSGELRRTAAPHQGPGAPLDGRFDSERMLRMLNEAVEAALNDGFAGLRTCGDMSWLLDDAPGTQHVVEYESLLNQFFS